MIDWLKESKARINEMGVSLRSPQEIVLARGRDFEEVLKETKLAYEKIKELGLDFLIPIIWKQSSTSVANNPAAVDGQGNGNGKGRVSALSGMGLPEDVISMLEDMADNIESLSN
jgi:hypothetical protein